jgi:hypothetical protein
MTIVYCHDKIAKTYPEQAFRLLRHESTHQILELRDENLAKQMKMEPGKFYCYYKPSLINGYDKGVGQLEINI